jgi:hypothetical protein
MTRKQIQRIATQGLVAVGIILTLLLAGGAPSDYIFTPPPSGGQVNP